MTTDLHKEIPVKVLLQRLHRELMRKMRSSGWQTSYLPAVVAMKKRFLQLNFKVDSSTELSVDQLDKAFAILRSTAIIPPKAREFRPLTMQQRKTVIRLGRYVLGERYGNNYFWDNLPKWIHEMHQGEVCQITGMTLDERTVRRIDDLTMVEADYIIKRMEKIEFKMKRGRNG